MNSNEEQRTKHEEPATALIFVYGTLRRGGSNHFRMEGAKFISTATTRGTLYKINWYPGLVLNPNGELIIGELFEASNTQIDALDAYEGPEYRRVRVDVLTENGETHETWVWEWNQATDGLTQLTHGDWLKNDDPQQSQ